MNTTLWNEIEKFDFDFPLSEYSFSTRLAYENYWTEAFTKRAIEEYKKFMFLAATSGVMVSPSEIIDIVWHQHLIFTESYSDFCKILGKQINHIPSTHKKDEIEKFLSAKKRTKELYEEKFGIQPKEFWDFEIIEDTFELEKSRYNIQLTIVYGILGLLLSIGLNVFLFKDIFISINNPDFLLFLIGGYLFTVIVLNVFNNKKLNNLFSIIKNNYTIQNLSPNELIFMKYNQLKFVIHGYVNFLIVSKNLKTRKDETLEFLNEELNNEDLYTRIILEEVKEGSTIKYKELLDSLLRKPILIKTSRSIQTLKSVIESSKFFMNLFIFNLIVFAFFISIGLSRLIIGIQREKKITFIVLAILIIVFGSILFLKKLLSQMTMKIIPKYFADEIIGKNKAEFSSWKWNYFIIGTSIMSVSFLEMAKNYTYESNFVGDNSNWNSGCSSCGSSCGGGCGGCGGCGS